MTVFRERWLYILMALAALAVTAAYQRSELYAVEFGTARDERYLEGFYGPERNNVGPFRWTSERADVRLPAMWPAQLLKLTIALSAPHPGEQGPVPVQLSLNNSVFTTPAIKAAPVMLDYALDEDLLGENGDFNLTIRVATFTAANDTRKLGVAVSRIEVTPLGAPPYVPSLKSLLIGVALVALAYVWLRRLGVRAWMAVGAAGVVILLAATGFAFARPVMALYDTQLLYTLAVAFVASECATWFMRSTNFDHTSVPASAFAVTSIARWTAALFLVAFGVRMVLAHSAGDPGNFIAFKMMITQVAEHGLASIYDLDPIVGAYPPVHHYDWALISFLYRTFVSPEFDVDSLRLNFLMKMPTITLDMVITVILMGYAAKRRGAKFALWAGAAFALNPGIIYTSAFNGQLGDPLYSLFITTAVVALLIGKPALFGSAAALALLTKPQSSAFIVFFALGWLCALPAHPKTDAEGDADLTTKLLSREQWQAVGAGLITAFVVLLPFIAAGTVGDMLRTVSTTIGHGPHLSANAYNLWWLIGWGDAWGTADTGLLLGLISYRTAGLILLFVAANGLLAWKLWRHHEPHALAMLAGFAGLAFFILPTEIHENYLFPTIPLLVLFAVHDRRAWLLWALLSVTWFVNLVFVDVDLVDTLTAWWPWLSAAMFPIQIVASCINIGVLLTWGLWVVHLDNGATSRRADSQAVLAAHSSN